MRLLVIDGCIRGRASRSKALLDRFLGTMEETAGSRSPHLEIQVVNLMEENLSCLSGRFFEEREELLARGELNHPRFRLAHEFAEADRIVIAAPFWDLSIPALLKVYIENISVEGITFCCNEKGMEGLCRASGLLFLTTRGSQVGEGELEHGARYLKALCLMYGIPEFSCVCGEGLDIVTNNQKAIMEKALLEAGEKGREWADWAGSACSFGRAIV